MESLDAGKPIGEAREDIAEVAFMFEYYGGWATKVYGEIARVGPDAMSLVVKEPMGVAAAITPWNYPMMMAVQKRWRRRSRRAATIRSSSPPSRHRSPRSRIPKILEEAGLPAGVLHVVTGFGETAGAPLVANPKVDKVGFTGSKEIGKLIMRSGADTLKRVTLELGGKSPNIVFADAEFDAAIEGSANGIFWNQGEICSAGSRVFIERPIYDDALNALVDHAKGVKLGAPGADGTTMGPLISREQADRVQSYIDVGASEATMAVQGARPDDPKLANGYFVPPTIFADVDNDARIAREESSDPVMSVIPFTSPEEVVALSNDNEYGLAAAVWTRDIKKGLNTARALRAGIVWIDDTQPAPTEAPWGGYKQSGIGRELGSQGIEDYLESKHIYVNLAE